jgi:choline dehydrogenase
MRYDHVIVGAGTAGCVLANRLSEDLRRQVLLIEAGGSDRNPLQRIPALGVLLNSGHDRRDWRYPAQPDPSRHDRVEVWSRGKLLGGTSSLNGMIYVRGAREDFDHWAVLGNQGWSYQDVAPLFRSLENHEFAHQQGRYARHYGGGGPLKVRQIRGADKLSHTFVAACGDLGIPHNPHYNAESQEGACILSVTQGARIRHSASQAFLEPIKHRRNLHILPNTQVTRVLLEGKRAVGVSVSRRGGGTTDFRAGRVCLSAGVIGSPQLLLLSGIGSALHLAEVGIPVRHDLPGVGQNLQDHPVCKIRAAVNLPTYRTDLMAAVRAGLNWLLFGRGPLMSAGCQALAFVKTRSTLATPDAQLHMIPGWYTRGNKHRVQFVDRSITLLANVSHSRSRGELKLASADPFDPPAIHPQMLNDQEDVNVLKGALQLCRALLSTKSMRLCVEAELAPGPAVQTAEQWEDYIRETAEPACHYCGTCKMGTDSMAVVDPRLNVHGMEGLSVIDASIMPTIPSGNTNASTFMIAENGAQMILRDEKATTVVELGAESRRK